MRYLTLPPVLKSALNLSLIASHFLYQLEKLCVGPTGWAGSTILQKGIRVQRQRERAGGRTKIEQIEAGRREADLAFRKLVLVRMFCGGESMLYPLVKMLQILHTAVVSAVQDRIYLYIIGEKAASGISQNQIAFELLLSTIHTSIMLSHQTSTTRIILLLGTTMIRA